MVLAQYPDPGYTPRLCEVPDAAVLADCCLDRDPEVHRVLTEKVFPTQAEVTTAAGWIAELTRS